MLNCKWKNKKQVTFLCKVYRRTLPIDYYENANGLVLRGENLDGSVSQLVFYSARGMQRMQDFTGKGPDEDPCGSHKK